LFPELIQRYWFMQISQQQPHISDRNRKIQTLCRFQLKGNHADGAPLIVYEWTATVPRVHGSVSLEKRKALSAVPNRTEDTGSYGSFKAAGAANYNEGLAYRQRIGIAHRQGWKVLPDNLDYCEISCWVRSQDQDRVDDLTAGELNRRADHVSYNVEICDDLPVSRHDKPAAKRLSGRRFALDHYDRW